MISLTRFPSRSCRLVTLLCLVTLALYGCSGSSSSNNDNDDNSNIDENGLDGGDENNGANGNGSDALQPVDASLTILADRTFRISWQTTPNTTSYRVLENPDGVSGFTNISGELDATTTQFDHPVALFARVNAQYIVQSCNDQGCVSSDPVLVNASLDNAITYLKSSDPNATASLSDEFGTALSISGDGNTLAVGAPSDGFGDQFQNDLLAEGAGEVYVFVRAGSAWQLQSLFSGSNTEASDRFGYSVSLSTDGNTLAVGAPSEDSVATGINGEQEDNSAQRSGAVYTFIRNGEGWQQQTYIKASNTTAFARFGWDVSLNADGNTLAVGARDENSDTLLGRGATYVFTRSDELWQEQAFIKTGTQQGSDSLGEVVSLSADGNTLAIGNSGDDSVATGINGDQNDGSAEQSGAAYVYVRNNTTWDFQAYIKASNASTQDQFGGTLSLSADGNTLAIGARAEDSAATGINADQNDNSAVDSGAAYVFTRSGEQWQQQTYIKASNLGVSDLFGSTVNLSADGNTLAVSALGEDSTATGINGDQFDGSAANSGAVYIFTQTSGEWQQNAYVKASNTGVDDSFGNALALNEDGSTLAVGARGEDSAATGTNGDQSENSATNAGAVYLY